MTTRHKKPIYHPLRQAQLSFHGVAGIEIGRLETFSQGQFSSREIILLGERGERITIDLFSPRHGTAARMPATVDKRKAKEADV